MSQSEKIHGFGSFEASYLVALIIFEKSPLPQERKSVGRMLYPPCPESDIFDRARIDNRTLTGLFGIALNFGSQEPQE